MSEQENNPAVASTQPLTRVTRALRDWIVLTKLRIGSFVIMAAFAGALLVDGPDTDVGRAFVAALYVGAIASAASIFNQVIERDLDRLMKRTQNRPLVTGRISARDAVLFAAALATVGTVGLAVSYGVLSALLGLSTLVAYSLVYTPLKRATSFNTVVGAIPGAMPPLLGYVAMTGTPGAWGWMLFAVVFVWQFPHFFAIAWIYREDYRRAGMKMLPALDGAEGAAGRQAFVYSLLLLPVSILPGVRGDAGWVFTLTALALGLLYVGASFLFAWRETKAHARAVVFVSLAYLPLVLTAALVDPVVSLVLRS